MERGEGEDTVCIHRLDWIIKVMYNAALLTSQVVVPGIQGTPELWDKQEKHLMENLMPDVKTDYGEDYILALKNFLLHMPSSCSSDLSPLLDDVLDALLAKSPHGLYTPGKNAYLALCIFCYFPLWFYDFFIGKSLCVKILPRALRGPDSKSKNT